ncbi:MULTISPECIES: hypothetical protein [unclassified Amycolatopsis]|uniref:hypothetical protein n=1 Tax=unclassified Amycolatopsis TaxID=2618356 RepID=UPI00106E6307|nr:MULTISPECIES: hypothetical protein [unclassified Amycolatopsis]
MPRLRNSVVIAGALVTGAVLSACSDPAPTPAPVPPAPQPDPAAAQQKIPDAFDAAKGWSAVGADGGKLTDPILAARAGAVLFAEASNDGKTVRVVAKDEKTGADRWTSAPVELPEEETNYHDVSTRLFETAKDGKDYAVLASTGLEGGDAVNKAKKVTHLDVFDIGATPDGGKAARRIVVPASASRFAVQDGGTALVEVDRATAVADVSTGQVATYEQQSPALKAPKPCEHDIGDCNLNLTVPGATAKGPLVQGFRAFWTSGGWFSGDVVPPGAKANVGSADVRTYGTPDGQHVLAAWPVEDDATVRMWAVHDAATGQVLASVRCAQSTVDDRGSRQPQPFLDPGGRYLVAGLVVFDLQAKKGSCFAETETRKAVKVESVGPDGIAYGTSEAPVRIDLSTGEAKPLAEETSLPAAIDRNVAVVDKESEGVYVYPRR